MGKKIANTVTFSDSSDDEDLVVVRRRHDQEKAVARARDSSSDSEGEREALLQKRKKREEEKAALAAAQAQEAGGSGEPVPEQKPLKLKKGDREMHCRQCNLKWAWKKQDIEYFTRKGYTNEPGRCPDCRERRQVEVLSLGHGPECHTCKQRGHVSKDCPRNGGDGGRGAQLRRQHLIQKGLVDENGEPIEQPEGGEGVEGGGGVNGCFVCGEVGHMSRDCPKKAAAGPNGCYNCGEEGHRSNECPKKTGMPVGGGNGSTLSGAPRSANGCYVCGEEGHMSRDCPKKAAAGANGCYLCGQEGHKSNECPTRNSGGGGAVAAGGGANSVASAPRSANGCYVCGEEGHMSRDCPKKLAAGANACYLCGREGHKSNECPHKERRRRRWWWWPPIGDGSRRSTAAPQGPQRAHQLPHLRPGRALCPRMPAEQGRAEWQRMLQVRTRRPPEPALPQQLLVVL